MIWCLKEREIKREKISRVNIYASKRFLNSKEVYFQGFSPPLFLRPIYEIKDEPHKQTIQKETGRNRTEYTYMWRKREKNGIKHSHVK